MARASPVTAAAVARQDVILSESGSATGTDSEWAVAVRVSMALRHWPALAGDLSLPASGGCQWPRRAHIARPRQRGVFFPPVAVCCQLPSQLMRGCMLPRRWRMRGSRPPPRAPPRAPPRPAPDVPSCLAWARARAGGCAHGGVARASCAARGRCLLELGLGFRLSSRYTRRACGIGACRTGSLAST